MGWRTKRTILRKTVKARTRKEFVKSCQRAVAEGWEQNGAARFVTNPYGDGFIMAEFRKRKEQA